MKRLVLSAAFVAAFSSLAFGQAGDLDHSFGTPGNATVGGTVGMSINSNNKAVPASATNPIPVTTVSSGVGAITPVVSTSGESSHVLKGSAGSLYGVYATNLTNTGGFLLVFNATSAPADGAVTPLACVPLPASGAASINNKPGPAQTYSTGITAVVSSASTCFTKTTGTITAFISGDVL